MKGAAALSSRSPDFACALFVGDALDHLDHGGDVMVPEAILDAAKQPYGAGDCSIMETAKQFREFAEECTPRGANPAISTRTRPGTTAVISFPMLFVCCTAYVSSWH